MSDTFQNDPLGVEEPRTIVEPRQDPEVTLEIRKAREMIPVGPTGVSPMNFAQQVDFAKTMTQAKAALPAHLRGNAGDCLAIIDIASRAGLSPYMVANKTYVQNDRLCFESQLFHALAQASGQMSGDFDVDYRGDGDEMICVVTGYLKGDPRPKVHESPPLGKVRPARNERGTVKGSPLWDKKPRVQLFYDTSRDWVRIYTPRATLGIYTPEEFEEYGPERAKDVTPLKQTLATADRTEGHQPGSTDRELANISPDKPTVVMPAEKPEATVQPDPKPRKKRTTKKSTEAPEPEKPEVPKVPKTPAQYVVYADAWIEKATDGDEADARWDGEYDLRAELSVPIKNRNELRAKIDAKFPRS